MIVLPFSIKSQTKVDSQLQLVDYCDSIFAIRNPMPNEDMGDHNVNVNYLILKESRAKIKKNLDSILNIANRFNQIHKDTFCLINFVEIWDQKKKYTRYVISKNHRYSDLQIYLEYVYGEQLDKAREMKFTVRKKQKK